MPAPWAAPPAPAGLHPLDGIDRPTVSALLAVDVPSDADLIHAARLVMRYRGSRLSPDLIALLRQAVERWSMTVDELFLTVRAIWASGRGSAVIAEPDQQIGSGADVES